MANSLCFGPFISSNVVDNRPGLISHKFSSKKANWLSDATCSSKAAPFEALKLRATDSKPSTKPNSIICAECDGDGAKKCTQCQGTGVNSVDHFNGQFKAGNMCWLCRGKKEILCGNCNGAGFIGGFMSTFDD
ncbi:DnaJ/Hsp40 cysteine-rich domain superfamily protein [Striga hermonthica]|uniref:DnaJ/Hsp40 cysteine-rich domain superfamily protein n=1 Tax=Striga hermonthica TaxID=68872 RepID=A0A9N7NNL5_STRHE|nr:DnaJ/Hsp40 cysteine-rich domain superfamily protein [Striga hermonthica]